jgi:hypothetical protein
VRTLRIVGHTLPGRDWSGYRNVHVGVQRRKEVVDLVPGDAAEAVFEIPLELSAGYLHGPPATRFVYLNWGEVGADGTFAMFRRAKIHLALIPDGEHPTARLALTDLRGGPVCASVKPDALDWTAPIS